MVFLELRRDSRVTTGNSGCLLCWPRQVQSSIRVAKESWALLSSGRQPQTLMGVIDIITLYKVLFMHYIMFLKSNSESQSTPDPRVSDERLYTCISNSNNILCGKTDG